MAGAQRERHERVREVVPVHDQGAAVPACGRAAQRQAGQGRRHLSPHCPGVQPGHSLQHDTARLTVKLSLLSSLQAALSWSSAGPQVAAWHCQTYCQALTLTLTVVELEGRTKVETL